MNGMEEKVDEIINKIAITSSGNNKEYINGELITDTGYGANFDGDILDLAIRDNDENYYTRLNKDELLELLETNYFGTQRENLFEQLLQKESKSKSKSKSEKKGKKGKKKEKEKNKLTRRQKECLINLIF